MANQFPPPPFSPAPPWAQQPAAPSAQPGPALSPAPAAAPPWAPPPAQRPPAPPWTPQPVAQPPASPWAPPPAPGGMSSEEMILGQVASAQTFGAGAAFFPAGGNFIVCVELIKRLASTDPKKLGHLLIVLDVVVEQSDLPDVPIGSQRSVTMDLNKYGAAAVKNLLTALNGGTPGDKAHEAALAVAYTPAKILEATSPANPWRGARLQLRTRMNKGGTFTKHDWRPIVPVGAR